MKSTAASLSCLMTIGTIGSAVANDQKEVLAEVTVEASRYVSDVSVASKTAVKSREIPHAVAVVTQQRIDDQKLTTLADALGTVTGVTIVPNDGLQSQYKSRGYALNVMYDGVPASQSLSGYLQLDLAAYERIEVLRGPTGLLQGSGDPAGSVNLVRKRGQKELASAVSATVGSWDKSRLSADIGGALNDRDSLLGRAVILYEERDDFADMSRYERKMGYGAVDWQLSDATRASLGIGVQTDRARASYSGLPSWSDGRLLDVPRSTNQQPTWNRSAWDSIDISGALQHDMAEDWSVTARVWQRDQQQFWRDVVADDGVRISDNTLRYGRREFDYDYQRRGVDLFVSGSLALFGRSHSLFFGYNFDDFATSFAGIERRRPTDLIRVPFGQADLIEPLDLAYDDGGETQREQSGFYAQARASLHDDLTLIAGARLSETSSRSRKIVPAAQTGWTQGAHESSHLSPTLGLVYDITPAASLYGSYADIFVPQSQLQVNGEPLEPRSGEQIEIGAKAELFEGRLNLFVAVYQLRDLHRSMADLVNPGFFIDAGEVQSKGWEAEIVGSPARGYEMQIGYSRLDSKFVVAPVSSQGERFSALEPKHAFKAWMVRQIDDGVLNGLRLGAGFNTQSGIEFEPPRTQGGYTLANALLGYRVAAHMTIDLNVNNIFDKVYYRRLGGTNSYNAFGPPRNYLLSITAKL